VVGHNAGVDDQDPIASASFSFEMTGEKENLWFLNISLLVAPILVALGVGFLGPFDGWAALLAAAISAVLTYALILGLWMLGMILWFEVSSRWTGRRIRRSHERP
jgi:hypothetical protein